MSQTSQTFYNQTNKNTENSSNTKGEQQVPSSLQTSWFDLFLRITCIYPTQIVPLPKTHTNTVLQQPIFMQKY